MGNVQSWFRRASAASKTDAALQSLRLVAIAYSLGFTLYLPVSKYTTMPAVEKYRWFAIYVIAAVYAQLFPYLPKSGQKKWDRAETARLRSTNVAISQIVQCVRAEEFGETNFVRIASGLMVAIRLEVEAITLDTDGTYINASLLIEDVAQADHLVVLQRANPDRPNTSYRKEGLIVWSAMQDQERKYVANFAQDGKEYRSILALPLIIETESGTRESIAVVSIDSGRPNEFDGLESRIELRLLPYISLLKLLLSMR